MENYGLCFMFCHNLCEAHLKDIPTYHVRVKDLTHLVQPEPSDESQGPLQLFGHGLWLVCEVAQYEG